MASEGRARTGLRSALWLPIFDDLADPLAVARLAGEAEEAGWHGFFVWDHLSWRAPVREVADPWITLAAAATATERLRLGPMVTPLARRRPAKVARETVTLDRLSGGRSSLPPGTDPAPYAEAGASWWLTEFDPGAVSLDQVRGVLRDGPAGS